MNSKVLGVVSLVALMSLPTVSRADLAFNVGAVSDYRYRGISQTRLKPAVQGGVDYSAGGLYLGVWASTIKWIKDFDGDAGLEVDLYGGYKGELMKGVGYDVGLLTYQYPGNKLDPSANTTEIYGALSYGPATLKYSHSLSDTFANTDSKNSYYLDLSASFEVMDGWSVAPHVGHQRIKGPFSGAASYWDYSLTVSKDFNGIVPSIGIVATSKLDKDFYTSPVGAKELGKAGLVLGVKYNF
jgi:uncharacterized protein (TIGR02001 family)